MAQSSGKKSTIDRSFAHGVSTIAFAIADVVAPKFAAAWAYHLWFELPPPARTAQTDPDGIVELLGSPFETSLRGRTIRGWTYGEGPVVYLVHGWSGHAEQLGPLVRHLLAQGLKVVAFDGLSHGRSDAGVHGSGSSDAVELGRSLDAVAARFGPARAVVAHSMGALAALLALRDGWLATERLVLIAPVDGVPDFLARFRSQLRFGSRTTSARCRTRSCSRAKWHNHACNWSMYRPRLTYDQRKCGMLTYRGSLVMRSYSPARRSSSIASACSNESDS